MAKKTSIELYNNALKDLKSGQRKPVYFFCGDEEFLLDKVQDAAQRLIADEHKDFNFDLLYGREVSPEQALSIARSYPMMSDQRVLIIRDFLSLNVSSYNITGSGGGLDDFLPYFEQPNPGTVLVLFDSRKPAGNTKLGKALKESKYVSFYQFDKVPDYRLPEWVIEWARHHHDKRIESGAAQMLAQFVGSNLQLLSTEIDKVCTFVDTSTTITEDDIKKIIGLYREYSLFELKEAFISRNLDQALFISEQMLQRSKANTGEIIRTVGFFYNVFSNIWQIRRLASDGNTKQQVQKELGIGNSWYFNKLWKEASTYSLNEMPKVFEALLDADRAAKGFSTMDPATILLLMIKRIIN